MAIVRHLAATIVIIVALTGGVLARELAQDTVVRSSSVRCSSRSSAQALSDGENAVAEASMEASAIACKGTKASVNLYGVAEGLAVASATAIASSASSCQTSGEASGCAAASAQADATASALGEAVANAFGSAASNCGCSANVKLMAKSFTSIIVSAHAESQSSVCSSGSGEASAKNYVKEFKKGSIHMFATAFIVASAGDGSCAIDAGAATNQTISYGGYTVNLGNTDCKSFNLAACDAETSGTSSNSGSSTTDACVSVGYDYYGKYDAGKVKVPIGQTPKSFCRALVEGSGGDYNAVFVTTTTCHLKHVPSDAIPVRNPDYPDGTLIIGDKSLCHA